MRRRSAKRAVLVAAAALLAGPAARAEPAPAPPHENPAIFALVLGVNAGPAVDVPALRYADDDAARYLDLFRALGARAYVLSRLDENTRALHPQAAAEALAPRHQELRQTVTALARDIARARARGVRSVLYVTYAGHGTIRDDEWYLTLEDGLLAGRQLLSELVERAGADQSHLIIDACHAYMLALPRGPGGTRRPLGGFVELEAASRAGRVGFLLSSSTSGESHEWEGFEAGVFSHEVRSGLYGAADADGDGRVTYPEIAAFVARANEGIVSERFRPSVLSRPGRSGDVLLDLRAHGGPALRLEGPDSGGHYLVESGAGVRLLDFHGDGHPIRLIRPPGEETLYLRRLGDALERKIPRTEQPVRMDVIPPEPARSQPRGAAHQAFTRIFNLPFGEETVTVWTRRNAEADARIAADAREVARRRRREIWTLTVGYAAGATAGAAAIASMVFIRSARDIAQNAPLNESHRATFARNQRIDSHNRAGLLSAATAVAAGAACLWLLWPADRSVVAPVVDLAWSGARTQLGARWRF